VSSRDVLAPLRDKFNASHRSMVKFYDECRGLRTLTSLISIPTLSATPPDFQDALPTIQSPRPISEVVSDVDLAEQEKMLREFERQKYEEEIKRQSEMQRRQVMMEEERMRMMQNQQQQNYAAMEHQLLQQKIMELQRELDSYKFQAMVDRQNAESAAMKMQALEGQLSQMSLQSRQMDSYRDDTIRKLQGYS
jgi:hypothetical protein